MIESGDGGTRTHASEFPPAPEDRPGAATTGAGTPAAATAVDVTAADGLDAGFEAGRDVDPGLGAEPGDAAGGAGEGPVRAALAPLERLATLPVRAHVAVYEQVFTELEATLATVAGESRTDASGGAAEP